MKQAKNSKKISIYMINNDIVTMEMRENKIIDDNTDVSIQEIIQYLSQRLKSKEYDSVPTNSVNDYNVCFMFKKTFMSRKANNDFFSPILVDKNLFDENSEDNRAVVIFYNHNKIYATTVGMSYNDIAPYIDDYFGIKVLGKCISQEKFEVFNQKTQAVTGYEKLNNSSYRNGCSLATVKKLENVLKEIGGKLYRELLPESIQKFFSKEKISIVAKSSIGFGNKLNFDQLIQILNWTSEVLDNKNKNVIMNGVEIIKKNSKEYDLFVSRAKNELWVLFQNYLAGDKEIDKFDILHKESDEFLRASRYELINKSGEVSIIDDLNSLNEIFKCFSNKISKDVFIRTLEEMFIVSYDENDNPLTSDKFINHLSGEIPYEYEDNTKVIIIDGEIIKLNGDYIKNIDDKLSVKISERIDENLNLLPWQNSLNETEYINKHSSMGCLIIHPKKPCGIELCDFIIKQGNIYKLVFVKKGFDYNVRDLSSQIKVSKQLITEDTFHEYIEKLFDILAKETDYATNEHQFDKQDLILALKNNRCHFIFAVYPENKNELSDQSKYQSIIAKISLDDLIGEFNKTNQTLKIYKINS